MTTRTVYQYQTEAEAIATAIWDISTGNGRDLHRDDWDSHAQKCHDAVANSYFDGIDGAEWQAAALRLITGRDGS